MRSTRGFTMFELLVVMAMITVIAGISIPSVLESTRRNKVWTATELIGSQVRQARLKAISRNMSFRIRFDCPDVSQFRVLQVIGNATIDNASDRCSQTQPFDSGVMVMPSGASYGDNLPILTVNSRGIISSTTGIPAVIAVTYGGYTSRSLTISATGQITFGAY